MYVVSKRDIQIFLDPDTKEPYEAESYILTNRQRITWDHKSQSWRDRHGKEYTPVTMGKIVGFNRKNTLSEIDKQLLSITPEGRALKNTLKMQDQRHSIIKHDKEAFDRYVKDLEEVDVDHLDNATLKRLFYKIHIVDMSHYAEGIEEPQRGLSFDYYFLQMPYSDLVENAVKMGYPHMEELPIDIQAF